MRLNADDVHGTLERQVGTWETSSTQDLRGMVAAAEKLGIGYKSWVVHVTQSRLLEVFGEVERRTTTQ